MTKLTVKPQKPSKPVSLSSKMRQTAMRIVAMDLAGQSRSEIAKILGLTERSVAQYLYMAGKHGWFEPHNPKDRIEYQISHKIVRNLDEMLDSQDLETRKDVTLEAAKGTIFKKFGETGSAPSQMNVLSIRVELPTIDNEPVREGAIGGLPRYIEGEAIIHQENE